MSHLKSNAVTEAKIFKIDYELPSKKCGYTLGPKYGIMAILQPAFMLSALP
ncbi:hypothetical protein Patl1_35551 [Pistacia atlantica]|nr:hypothetical protein Patl1_35551 [Pistacia atlantica]